MAIFQLTSNEINIHLKELQESLRVEFGFVPLRNDSLLINEATEASGRISIGLVYANFLIFITGGIGSFLLAKRTLRPIQEAHEAQSRFTSDASHELRTPLATMKAEIEVTLRDKQATESDLKQVLNSNLEEVEKLSRLSEMLLSLSRLDNDKLERTVVNLSDITQEVLRRYNLPPKRITVKTTAHSLVEGNEAALSELVAILVDNAIKYSPNDSLISITLARRNHHLALFEISNSGQGIERLKLPHIFDRFYRADTSRTKSYQKGYGLGLALAKKIVELHNGELSASSAPNHITRLTFLLPIIQ
ncbi:GHKL domain-containing protein [Candidatus Saccharibacteria bacterium]|nr:GHKL domain-containing protein [Candidatus Saccharibacteria bacterium]